MGKKLITFNDVIARVPYTKVHIYRLIERGKFPAPRKLGAKTVWFEHEIDEYLDSLPVADEETAARHRPGAS